MVRVNPHVARVLRPVRNRFREGWWEVLRRIDRVRHPSDRGLILGDKNLRWRVPGWETVDRMYADYSMDLNSLPEWPIPDDCFSFVYSSHMFEHLSDAAIRRALSEAHRVMKRAGVIRLVFPDFDEVIDAYRRGDREWHSMGRPVQGRSDYWAALEAMISRGVARVEHRELHNRVASWVASYGGLAIGPIIDRDVVDRVADGSMPREEFFQYCRSRMDPGMKPGGHVNGLYLAKIEPMLRDAGFVAIEKSSYRQSAVPIFNTPRFDYHMHRRYSLYVEAVKPPESP